MKDIPARIEDLISTVTSTFELVSEHSRPGPGRPQVWEVRGGDGQRWFVKRHAGPKRTAYAVLDALDAVRWGVDHHDIDLVDEAHTMIANLRAESTRRSLGR
ncbi:hypothetical protein ACGFYZ_33025 [Streptomyces sp. NPDC048330]|uniref:hypothetical protein n=1 Tax=Streptomyces sp. NPDC048330 TaxID=3365533 RepID=UPI0037242E84